MWVCEFFFFCLVYFGHVGPGISVYLPVDAIEEGERARTREADVLGE